MTDDNSLTGRVRRYAQVSSAMGGLAARLAGERYLGLNLDRRRHAAELKAVLGGIKGPLMKVAQLLATIPDALPKEYVAELVQLQADAPAMGWLFVKRRMAAELGPGWERRFKSFAHEATRAASLGQVHRAEALDGRLLAWYRPLYGTGVIHGDPHLGNYTVREDRSINLLDFGCIRVFPASFVKGVIDLYHALLKGDEELAVSAYEAWNFRNLSREVIE